MFNPNDKGLERKLKGKKVNKRIKQNKDTGHFDK
jgi:hypothetical protein